MALTAKETDAVQSLVTLGLSRDQSSLALVRAKWDKVKAASNCLELTYTVSARLRPKPKLCTKGCGYFTGGKEFCCTSCTGKGPHTQHCKDSQDVRRQQHEGVLDAAGGAAEEREAAAGAQVKQEPEEP